MTKCPYSKRDHLFSLGNIHENRVPGDLQGSETGIRHFHDSNALLIRELH